MKYIEDLNVLTDFDKIKDYLYMECRPIDYPVIKEKNLVFTQCGDIAITYNVCLELKDSFLRGVRITNELLDKYGMSVEELHQYVAQTASAILEPVCESVDHPAFADILFHVTNSSNVSGASVMFYYDFLPDLSEKLGKNLFVVPLSVNDFMVCADDGIIDPSDLECSLLLSNDNRDQDDFLSDSIYYYDYMDHSLFQMEIGGEEPVSHLN